MTDGPQLITSREIKELFRTPAPAIEQIDYAADERRLRLESLQQVFRRRYAIDRAWTVGRNVAVTLLVLGATLYLVDWLSH